MRQKEEPQQALLIPPEKPAPATDSEIKGFALVEIFGHQRIVGFLSQQAFGSGVLFRIDVPDLTSSGKVIRDGFTRYFGLAAIYSITPISEDVMRKLLPNIDGTPGEARSLTSRSYSHDDGY